MPCRDSEEQDKHLLQIFGSSGSCWSWCFSVPVVSVFVVRLLLSYLSLVCAQKAFCVFLMLSVAVPFQCLCNFALDATQCGDTPVGVAW